MNANLSDEQKDACLRVLHEGLVVIRMPFWEARSVFGKASGWE